MKIQKQRLWQHIQDLGNIGKQADGSITRLAFSDEDEAGAKLVQRWMKEAGMQVHVDACGNIIATLQGTEPTLSPIVCGSHIDSVPCGGMFDGCVGVLAGIEAVQTMIEHSLQPLRTIHIIAFRDEEGVRFGYGMVGSKAITGVLDPSAFKVMDAKGESLAQAMEHCGYQPQAYQSCRLYPHAYIELHIEQASVLEQQGVPVGIVEGIAGLRRYTITISGISNHAGAQPMDQRADPVPAMCAWITKITSLAQTHPNSVATIGSITTSPGACNIICDHVSFSLDIRSLYDSTLDAIEKEMRAFEAGFPKDIQVTWKLEQSLPPCLCDPTLQAQAEAICQTQHIPMRKLMSGAGHDAMNFKDCCPCALLFVRSQKGASHKKEEYTTPQDCAIGCELLYQMLRQQSQA